ncbi:MAG TPA: thioredoxin domain-containing protein [Solirubrobacterales bacterium]|nr:thioredoxin domain-containing protein [Solirubrobacterales bacterium]
MSNKRAREERREQRLAEESKVESKDRRTRLLQFGAGAVFLAIVVVVILIVVNGSSSSSSSGGDAKNVKEVAEVEKLLSGIDQEGMTLGDPKAPVELIEYGDLQCPICKEYSEEFLPAIIEGQVAQGQAKITFKNFVIISEESYPAGHAAIAAGEQGLGWSYIETWYRNQGEERSGYVTDEFMTSIAKAVRVPNMKKWNEARNSPAVKKEVEETTSEALNKLHFNGTPSFAIQGPGTNGLELLGTPESVGDFEEAINAAS